MKEGKGKKKSIEKEKERRKGTRRPPLAGVLTYPSPFLSPPRYKAKARDRKKVFEKKKKKGKGTSRRPMAEVRPSILICRRRAKRGGGGGEKKSRPFSARASNVLHLKDEREQKSTCREIIRHLFSRRCRNSLEKKKPSKRKRKKKHEKKPSRADCSHYPNPLPVRTRRKEERGKKKTLGEKKKKKKKKRKRREEKEVAMNAASLPDPLNRW